MENESPVSEYGAKFLAEMEAKYAALGAAIASVRAALNITGGLGVVADAGISPQATGAPGAPVSLPRGAFLGKKIPEAIKLYLSAARKTQANKEIAQALRDGGLKTKGNLDVLVTGSLFNLKKQGVVLRFDDGWGLSEWYPESFRNQAQDTQVTTKKKSKGKAKAKAKAKTKRDASDATPKPAIGLQQRVDAFLRTQPTRVFPAQEIANALGVNLGALNLTLGKMLAAGKVQKWQGGYQAPEDNVQQMPKAV